MSPCLRKSALIAVVVIGLISATLWLVNHDEPLPDISDLSPRPRILAPEKNGYLALTHLAAEIGKTPPDGARDATFDRLVYEGIWNDADADLVLAGNESILNQFATARALEQGESPLPRSVTDLTPHVGGLQRLWRLAGVRTRVIALRGDADEAVREAIETLKGTRAITTAGGPLIEYLTGNALHGISHHTLRETIAMKRPSSETLRECIEAIESSRSTSAVFTENLKTEFFYTRLALNELPNKYREWEKMPYSFVDKAPPLAHWFFKPNKTLRLIAERQRAFIQKIDRPYSEQNIPDELPFAAQATLFWKLPHPENALGRHMLSITTDTYVGVLRRRLRDQSNISLTQAWLGVLLYLQEHGHPPSSLDQLVPAYLPSVPRDYYTGNSIRYSAELSTLWSAGEDNLVITTPEQKVSERALVLKLPDHSL